MIIALSFTELAGVIDRPLAERMRRRAGDLHYRICDQRRFGSHPGPVVEHHIHGQGSGVRITRQRKHPGAHAQ
jgi:hypothetical protein